MNEIIIDVLAVLLDKDYSIYQKKAGLLLLKHFFTERCFTGYFRRRSDISI